MPLPLYKEGEIDNKPPHQKDCYLNGSQNGMVRDTVNMTDLVKRTIMPILNGSIHNWGGFCVISIELDKQEERREISGTRYY